MVSRLLWIVLVMGCIVGVWYWQGDQSPARGNSAAPVEVKLPGSPLIASDRINGIPVDVELRLIEPRFEVTRSAMDVGPPEVADPLRRGPPPYPKGVGAGPADVLGPNDPALDALPPSTAPAKDAKNAPLLVFNSSGFDDNQTLASGLFIPPDTHTAAGPAHVVNVTNVLVRMHNKTTGASVFQSSLRSFFTANGFVGPVNATFDPKVLFDSFSNRWLIVTLEKTAANSALFVAVSATNDPTGSWFLARIPALQIIAANNCWFDYPGFAVDEEAVYIIGNYFRLSDNANCGETRLFILSKSFYNGSAVLANIINPAPPGSGGLNVTLQPAEIYGTAPAGSVGTFMVGFSGVTINGGGESAVQVTRIDSPLTTPTLNLQFIGLGQLLQSNSGAAPQSGTATTLATNDRRTLQAVWRNNQLYFAFSSRPPVAAADAAENAAWWGRISTSNIAALSRADFGKVGGDELTANAHTFFPAIAVNAAGDLAIGFSVVGSAIFPSSAYTWRAAADPAGTTRASQILRSGTDFYVRTLGGAANRWGDYSGASVDPVDGCFWISNQHAIARGTVSGGDGRWQVATARFCSGQVGWIGFANGFE